MDIDDDMDIDDNVPPFQIFQQMMQAFNGSTNQAPSSSEPQNSNSI